MLKNIIVNELSKKPFMKFSEFMRLSNSHAQFGYYTNKKNILGARGDFITSPDITQMFGECIGIYIARNFQICPVKDFEILELGPGRGILTRDIIRTLKQINHFSNSKFDYKAIEINENFKSEISNNLLRYCHSIEFFSSIYDANLSPSTSNKIIIAHEFFDALPIDIFKETQNKILEVKLTNSNGNIQLCLTDSAEVDEYVLRNIKKTQMMEYSIEVVEHIDWIKKQISVQNPSLVLGIIADYGYNEPSSVSIRSIKNHRFVGLFDHIGEADYSANVDFKLISSLLKQSKVYVRDVCTQARFLIENAIFERLKYLETSHPTKSSMLRQEVYRLLSSKEMGNIYKFLLFQNFKPNDVP